MLNSRYHVRAHWSPKDDWSGWIEAPSRVEAITRFLANLSRRDVPVKVPEEAHITVHGEKR